MPDISHGPSALHADVQVRMGTSAVPGNAARQRSRLMWRQQQQLQQQYLGSSLSPMQQRQQQQNAMAYMGAGSSGPMQHQNPNAMAYLSGGMQPMQSMQPMQPMGPAPGLMVQQAPYGAVAQQMPPMW